jgi:hypothetical protein
MCFCTTWPPDASQLLLCVLALQQNLAVLGLMRNGMPVCKAERKYGRIKSCIPVLKRERDAQMNPNMTSRVMVRP